MIYILTELPTKTDYSLYTFDLVKVPFDALPKTDISVISQHSPSARAITEVLPYADMLERPPVKKTIGPKTVFIYAKFNTLPNSRTAKSFTSNDITFYRMIYRRAGRTNLWRLTHYTCNIGDESTEKFFANDKYFTIDISDDMGRVTLANIWNPSATKVFVCENIIFDECGTVIEITTCKGNVFVFEIGFIEV